MTQFTNLMHLLPLFTNLLDLRVECHHSSEAKIIEGLSHFVNPRGIPSILDRTSSVLKDVVVWLAFDIIDVTKAAQNGTFMDYLRAGSSACDVFRGDTAFWKWPEMNVMLTFPEDIDRTYTARGMLEMMDGRGICPQALKALCWNSEL